MSFHHEERGNISPETAFICQLLLPSILDLRLQSDAKFLYIEILIQFSLHLLLLLLIK